MCVAITDDPFIRHILLTSEDSGYSRQMFQCLVIKTGCCSLEFLLRDDFCCLRFRGVL